jgi:putative membrane protein
MKHIFRLLVVNIGALWATSQILPGLVIIGGIRGVLIGAAALMLINVLIVPFIKILLLPLNLLTVGLFAWLTNVIALYFLVAVVPAIKIVPYYYPGEMWGKLQIPAFDMSTIVVTVVASLLLSIISHTLSWLVK